MRRLAASYIYTEPGRMLKNGILEIDEESRIINLIDTGGGLRESANLEYYNGVIVPGFIDCFCQIEQRVSIIPLSDKKNRISSSRQTSYNNQDKLSEYKTSIKREINSLRSVGTVAAANLFVSNRGVKVEDNSWFSLINFTKAQDTLDLRYKSDNLPLYHFFDLNTKEEILNLLASSQIESHNLLALPISEAIIEIVRSDPEHLPNLLWIIWNKKIPTNNISLENVFTILAPRYFKILNETIPNIVNLTSTKNLCLGTGNPGNKQNLSLLEDMKLLHLKYPQLKLEEILSWATINGAKAIGREDELGSFERGKRPGVNLITQMDLRDLKLLDTTRIKSLA